MEIFLWPIYPEDPIAIFQAQYQAGTVPTVARWMTVYFSTNITKAAALTMQIVQAWSSISYLITLKISHKALT
jgi:hypothetical protein